MCKHIISNSNFPVSIVYIVELIVPQNKSWLAYVYCRLQHMKEMCEFCRKSTEEVNIACDKSQTAGKSLLSVWASATELSARFISKGLQYKTESSCGIPGITNTF